MSLRSMLGLRGHEEVTGPPPGTTHVLYFIPRGCPDYDAWYLVPVSDWCGDRPPREWDFLGENAAGRDLPGEYSAGFAEEVLGFPVAVTRFVADFSAARFWVGHGHLEPAYWITPAA